MPPSILIWHEWCHFLFVIELTDAWVFWILLYLLFTLSSRVSHLGMHISCTIFGYLFLTWFFLFLLCTITAFYLLMLPCSEVRSLKWVLAQLYKTCTILYHANFFHTQVPDSVNNEVFNFSIAVKIHHHWDCCCLYQGIQSMQSYPSKPWEAPSVLVW